jgi:hypothetical protein
MSAGAPQSRVFIPNKPEQRLSIAVDRLLDRALLQPCYFTAIHDADGGGRTDNQRARDRNRGIKSGQLDWDVVQGKPTLCRKLELKRGKNILSPAQQMTVAALDACGAPPIVAWTLEEVYRGLCNAGFRFAENARVIVAELAQHLAAWDREAEGIKAGVITKKPSKPRKAAPRYTMTKAAVSRSRKAGIPI